VWSFYPKFLLETLVKQYRWVSLYIRLRRIYLRIKHDPHRKDYKDMALTPVADEVENLEMFHSVAAQAYLGEQRRLDKARHGDLGVAVVNG
jgi:hypothetical protein